MTGNLIKDMVLMSRGLMLDEPEICEPEDLRIETVCTGDCNACKKCETEG